MIYTLTMNPSLDYIATVDRFVPGMTNRTSKEIMYPGGKGINVSIVLKNFGYDSKALGFTAGFTGREIERLVKEAGIVSDFIPLENGISRINVKLRGEQETEVNGMGPVISVSDISLLFDKLDTLASGDILILAGSIPASVDDHLYENIMDRLKGRGIRILVDATKDLLMNVLDKGPFLIKPNNHELGEIFGITLKGAEECVPYAKKLQEKGAKNVMVSLGGEGGLLLAETGEVFSSPPPKGKLVNSVGAGDSMVAGFLAGYLHNNDYEEAFYTGLCTGSASAFSEELARKHEVDALLSQFGKSY